ncbi:phosphatase PAP2 family protein [Niabella drilacis]|uniref:Outer membrane protein beta-barrel domain-containing protein n=1 Tax=Niabella drilacis (strain DSM 25811 / CCM 8410 / CCUG 62505 / LMG 26954 / E90) TaxID=1285928 RepID=A0A1G6PUS4_NIADE|nr:phosphatase PAP2 family protein [Niabella drilacis]SDC83970.1 Outer membrane protein beta-barrel domain-containing protein [Niabella drilacis]
MNLFGKQTVVFIYCFCCAVAARAQQEMLLPDQPAIKKTVFRTDSSFRVGERKPFFEKQGVEIGFAPALFLAASAVTWGEKKSIREVRNRYLPGFKHTFDNYAQYLPAATTFGLKFAGVKGRNKLLRSAFSYGASVAIMGILVNGIKYTAKVERPDGTSKNSFPSGHTAMAFTNATFMHKEYGLVNPSYSIAGYGTATFTGIARGMNNRHWFPDILAGAGIGILSTQLGYFFIDRIYKNKGDNLNSLAYKHTSPNPSFLAIKWGYANAMHNLAKNLEINASSKLGFEAGLEGAYFFNRNWGIGGDLSFTSFPITASEIYTPNAEDHNVKFETQSIGTANIAAGPYYALHLADRWQLMLKAHGGYSIGSRGTISVKTAGSSGGTEEIAAYKPANTFRVGTGGALTYKLNSRLGVTGYADYHYTNPVFKYTFNEKIVAIEPDFSNRVRMRNHMDYVVLGLRLTAYF